MLEWLLPLLVHWWRFKVGVSIPHSILQCSGHRKNKSYGDITLFRIKLQEHRNSFVRWNLYQFHCGKIAFFSRSKTACRHRNPIQRLCQQFHCGDNAIFPDFGLQIGITIQSGMIADTSQSLFQNKGHTVHRDRNTTGPVSELTFSESLLSVPGIRQRKLPVPGQTWSGSPVLWTVSPASPVAAPCIGEVVD